MKKKLHSMRRRRDCAAPHRCCSEAFSAAMLFEQCCQRITNEGTPQRMSPISERGLHLSAPFALPSHIGSIFTASVRRFSVVGCTRSTNSHGYKSEQSMNTNLSCLHGQFRPHVAGLHVNCVIRGSAEQARGAFRR